MELPANVSCGAHPPCSRAFLASGDLLFLRYLRICLLFLW